MYHKYGLGNNYARGFQSDPLVKPKVKDYSYYARRAQELVESEKSFVAPVSRSVEG